MDRQSGIADRQESMVVRTHNKGREVLGLQVGASNARRFFPKDTSVIELELDHLHIQCRLKPEFWDGQPEIRDPRLCAWLKHKSSHNQICNSRPTLALIPIGPNVFRLRIIARSAQPPNDTFAPEHSPLTAA